MPVTPLYAAIFAVLYVLLALSVIKQRGMKKVSLGAGDDDELRIAIRIHANFGEYVPLALILMWFLETILFDSTLAFYLGALLLAGRIAHVIGMRNGSKYMIFRQLGMVATFSMLLIAAARLFWHYLPI